MGPQPVSWPVRGLVETGRTTEPNMNELTARRRGIGVAETHQRGVASGLSVGRRLRTGQVRI